MKILTVLVTDKNKYTDGIVADTNKGNGWIVNNTNKDTEKNRN